jgi:novobiocin biosynthesis protein NovU/D-mycarose 3-C-methyltransferase
MYKSLTSCRACGSTDFVEAFKFDKPMALANDWALPGGERKGFVPVRVLFCRDCTLGQLGETVDPEVLYKNYLYVTSNSQTMLRHFDRLTKDLISENGVGSLLEVGSNDGRFLKFAHSKGFNPVVGIDPAENLLSESSEGVSQIVGFFDKEYADTIDFSPDTIVARHCFCHQEWRPFMQAVEAFAHQKTLVAIEVPYAPDLLRKCEWDSIYSEHTSYLTLRAVAALLKSYPFHIHGVLRYGVHGGAVLIMLRHNDCGIIPHLSADEMLHGEDVRYGDWNEFWRVANDRIDSLKRLVFDLKIKDGKTISVFGASAKAAMMINACGFTHEQIDFVTDNSPLKPGRLVPGTQIPVIEESEMLSHHPNYAIMSCWNYKSEVMEKTKKWQQRGGRFILPMDGVWQIV